MGLVLVTPAGSEPVTLALAKLHLKVDITDDDTLLISGVLIPAARRWVEEHTGRQMLPATWRLSFTGGPGWDWDESRPEFIGAYYGRPIPLHRAAPLISMTSVTYTDTAGATQTLTSPTGYRLDSDSLPARLWPAYSTPWPSCRQGPSAFNVTFQSGYANAAAVPQDLIAAMLLLIGHGYEFREDVVEGQFMRLPRGADDLIAPYRVGIYG